MPLALPLGVSVGAHVVVALALLTPRAERASPSDPPPQLAGETFELPAPEMTDVPLANASPSPEMTGAPAATEDGDSPARPSPPPAGRSSARSSHAGRPSGGRADSTKGDPSSGDATTPALYGAVGDRSAADLATAFTRAFPQAASGDPSWQGAPLGSAGNAVVTVTLDERGSLESMQVAGSPSPALSSAIRRTLALIKGRPFVASAKVTHLRLTATVSADAVHDGWHGDVFAIGGSYAGGEGSAFFALAIGRRIDLRVRAK
jgi:hypothetical protein